MGLSCRSPDSCLFVLETIRTGTMRVIHITVKTEETQRLRIKFVLVLPYLNNIYQQFALFNVDNASLKSERFFNRPDVLSLLREIHQFLLYRKYSACVM